MQPRAKYSVWAAVLSVVLAAGWAATPTAAFAQRAQGSNGSKEKEGSSAPTISEATGKILNEAIELLNMENYAGAQEKIGALKLDRLSPYEHSKVEQILFQISYAQEKYDDARSHLQKAIDAGGLNEQEISSTRYQMAQLYIVQEKWKEGAAALEEWFKTAMNPNSAAYYMLAVSYYSMNQFDKAIAPAKKAVELSDKPQEGWIQLLYALYMQKEQYKDAVPLVERLISIAPEKKNYWMQLSSVYGQMEDYPKALAIMQLAYNAGLVTEDSEYRRLADLLVFNQVPYRGARVLETGIEKKVLTLDDKLYEKLANCWIAAAELDKAIEPLQKGAELAKTGEMYERLGEVQVQREDWPGAISALQKGIDKGQLKDLGEAQLMMGISYYNQKDFGNAKPWLERAQKSEKHRQIASSYLQAIKAAA